MQGDVAQRLEQLLVRRKVRRFESGRPRFSWWSWCNGSIRGRDPRGSGSNPDVRPLLANAEHRRAPRAVNAVPRAVVVRLHPFASTRGRSSGGGAPRLQRGPCGFDSHRLHQRLRSVNGKHAPFVRPRCGFNSCRRLSGHVQGTVPRTCLVRSRPRDCPWNVSCSVTLADVAQ